MKIEITNSDHYPIWIESYQHGNIVINDTSYNHSIAIRGSNIIPIDKSFHELVLTDLIPGTHQIPEVIILGTGQKQLFLPSKLQVELYQNGLRVDVMSTYSAVHTFNLLIADNRNVWAWLWVNST